MEKANQLAMLEKQAELSKVDRDREFQLKMREKDVEAMLKAQKFEHEWEQRHIKFQNMLERATITNPDRAEMD